MLTLLHKLYDIKLKKKEKITCKRFIPSSIELHHVLVSLNENTSYHFW